MRIPDFLQLSAASVTFRILLILGFSGGFIFLILALSTCFIPSDIIVNTFLPLISSLFSPDGIISSATINLLMAAIAKAPGLFAGISLCSFIFALTGIIILGEKKSRFSTSDLFKPFPSEIPLILLILGVAIFLRLGLMGRGLCYDELFSTVYSIGPKSLYGDEGRYMTSQHIGYTPFAIISSSFFGLTEWAVRLPALVFGLIGIFITWFIGKRVFSSKLMLIVAGLLAISPAHIAWSVTARGYSGYILTTTLLVFLYLSMLKNPKTAHQLLIPLFAVTGYFFHSLSLSFLAVACLHLCVITLVSRLMKTSLPPGCTKCWESIGIAVIAVLVFCAPFISRTFVEINAYAPEGLVPDFPITLWNTLISGPWNFLNIIAFILLLTGLLSLWKKSPPILALFLLLLLLPLGMWISRPTFLYERFWIGLLPFIFLIITDGILWLYQQGIWGKIPAVIITFLILGGSLFSLASGRSPMITDVSWSLREDLHTAETMLPDNTPVYALKGHDQFFRYYLRHPVITLDTEADYDSILQYDNHPAFFILAGLIKSASHSSRPILKRLRSTTPQQTIGDLSIFIR